jgi:hypothetical protein
MDNWSDFFFLCGSSAAGLTGLMFIAVTFGSKFITKENLGQVNVFLSPICFHFIQVFFLCCIAEIPIANTKALGLIVLLSSVWRTIRLTRTIQLMKATALQDPEIEASDWMVCVYAPIIAFTALIGAGIGFMIQTQWAVYVFSACLLTLLFIGALGAWEMLIWIATKTD